MEHGSLENLNQTRRHETIEITAFHEHVDRDATTGNQNCTVGGVATKIPEGFSANGTTHSQGRSQGNLLRKSLLSLKKRSGWFNHRKKRGSQYLKKLGGGSLENHSKMWMKMTLLLELGTSLAKPTMKIPKLKILLIT